MRVLCLGLNHETASVALREKISFTEKGLIASLHAVAGLDGIEENVILSTCNRTEIYAALDAHTEPAAAVQRLQGWIETRFALGGEEWEAFYRHEHHHTVRHLFRVASGLNSMVLGETEIFGQVKKAYAIAHRAGTTGKTLNRIFQHSFRVGKYVRTHTHITRGATSVGTVGVELAEKIFGDLRHCKILLIGAGEISRRTAQSLQSRGVNTVIVSNRSFDRARELAKEINGKAIRFDDWGKELAGVDIVISSTAAPHPVVTAERLRHALKQRRGRPLFMIDLSVPRDIAPDVRQLEGVYVHDLDALQRLATAAQEERQRQLGVCQDIIDQHVRDLMDRKPDMQAFGATRSHQSESANPLTTS